MKLTFDHFLMNFTYKVVIESINNRFVESFKILRCSYRESQIVRFRKLHQCHKAPLSPDYGMVL